jgi:hypothetical protein
MVSKASRAASSRLKPCCSRRWASCAACSAGLALGSTTPGIRLPSSSNAVPWNVGWGDPACWASAISSPTNVLANAYVGSCGFAKIATALLASLDSCSSALAWPASMVLAAFRLATWAFSARAISLPRPLASPAVKPSLNSPPAIFCSAPCNVAWPVMDKARWA